MAMPWLARASCTISRKAVLDQHIKWENTDSRMSLNDTLSIVSMMSPPYLRKQKREGSAFA
eukprot:6145726-Pleurochrysis_carterae.AAC.1